MNSDTLRQVSSSILAAAIALAANAAANAQTPDASSATGAAPSASALGTNAGPSNASSSQGLGLPTPPNLTPGTAGAARVPQTGSIPNAATADYPTDATADYVFGCMASNGETRTALEQCSCSFDVVATLLPYERYIEASTFLSMGQVAGEKGSLFRSSEEAKASVGDLRRAQAEAEVRCF